MLFFFFLIFSCATALSNDPNIFQLVKSIPTDEKQVEEIRAQLTKVNSNSHDQKKKKTLLHYAKHPAIIHDLIMSGAHLNRKDYKGRTPLTHALLKKLRDKAIVLILSGANVNVMDYNKNTPLKIAIDHDDYELVLHILRAGTRIDQNLITFARQKGSSTITQLLLFAQDIKQRKHIINKFDQNGQNELHKAVLKSDPILVDALLIYGACINGKTAQGDTPLHLAVKNNKPLMVEKLLIAGAKPNIYNNQDETPLRIALQQGYRNIVDTLIKNGAQSNL